MADCLFVVADEGNPDPYVDCKRLKPGDVIAVVTEDDDLGTFERECPLWRRISFSGYTVRELQVFLSPEYPTTPDEISPMLQPRQFRLDLAQLPSDWLADDKRTEPVCVFPGDPFSLMIEKSPWQSQQ